MIHFPGTLKLKAGHPLALRITADDGETGELVGAIDAKAGIAAKLGGHELPMAGPLGHSGQVLFQVVDEAPSVQRGKLCSESGFDLGGVDVYELKGGKVALVGNVHDDGECRIGLAA